MTHAPTMVSLVEDYLAARRQMGFALGIAGEQLLAFGASPTRPVIAVRSRWIWRYGGRRVRGATRL